MKPSEYTNHSGGAKGADMMWDEIGRKYGVVEHLHWLPKDLESLPPHRYKQMLVDVQNAAIALKRPHIGFRGVAYVQRNWLQVHYADAIYAVAYIIPPGDVDYQGYTNETGKEIVAGGTGWAVEMGVQKGKLVYVFDMNRNVWCRWNETFNKFSVINEAPYLTKNFAGIGSRVLTPGGIKAIEDVYIKTFNNAKVEKEETEEGDPTS